MTAFLYQEVTHVLLSDIVENFLRTEVYVYDLCRDFDVPASEIPASLFTQAADARIQIEKLETLLSP